jgi:hypothetical protein
LINSLKEGSGFEGLDSSTANSMELEELRHEKEMQREEIQKLMGQIHQLKSELQVRVTVIHLPDSHFLSTQLDLRLSLYLGGRGIIEMCETSAGILITI